ncbi:MAG: UbiA family prenyltransferase [Haloarculaceae archaeon]
MALSTRGRGPVTALRALASQVHPVFMLPAVASSLFGGVFARGFDAGPAAVHALAVFFGLYAAHVTDGYVDFYVRDEDDDHPLTARGCRLTRAGAAVAFLACCLALWWLVGPVAALVTAPGLVVGLLHAPVLDTNPVGATAGYPTGIALALVGGYYVQARAFSASVLALAGVFLVVLSGIKVIDDAQDYEYDRSIGKRTVAVAVGPRGAHRAAYALMTAGMVGVGAMAAVLDGVPPSAVGASAAFGAVALVARRADPELATMLLIRGSYLFLAVLVAAVWFRPFG